MTWLEKAEQLVLTMPSIGKALNLMTDVTIEFCAEFESPKNDNSE